MSNRQYKTQNMEKITICYDFSFCIAVQNRKGKIYKKYKAQALGSTYKEAVWSLFFDLKKKRKILLNVNDVRVTGIAFAYHASYQSIHHLKLTDYPLQLPENLNAEIASLPQKKEA